MLRQLAWRLVRSYTTAPTLRQWGEAVLLLVLFSLVALPVGLASGLLTATPCQDSVGAVVVFAAVAFAVPSLFEETLFRALLLPHPSEQRSRRGLVVAVLVAVSLFVLGHPLAGWLFAPAARPLFYNPVFLGVSAVFGVVDSVVYLRTGSVWPSTLMHWAVVLAWKVWFGGWIMAFGPSSP